MSHHPKFPDLCAAFDSAELLRVRDKKEEAIAAYGDILEHYPNHPPSLFWRAYLRSDLGSFASALEDIDTFISIDPSNSRAFYIRHMILRMTGDLPLALLALQRAVDLAPEAYHLLVHRGVIRRELGMVDEGNADLAEFSRLAALERGYITGWQPQVARDHNLPSAINPTHHGEPGAGGNGSA